MAIDTPSLKGSIALVGARFDDLYLCNPARGAAQKTPPCYRTDVAKSSPPVELFTPLGARYAYFARFGWDGPVGAAPDRNALWTLVSGQTLTPKTPVVLGYTSPSGVTYRRTVSVDDNYMFTIADAVTNGSAAAVTLQTAGTVKRQGLPDDVLKNAFNVHQGAVGFLGGDLKMWGYKDWKKKPRSDLDTRSKGGWLGITDKYWMAAMAPDQAATIVTSFVATTQNGVDVFEADYKGAAVALAPGQTTSTTTRLFAGAKRSDVISAYEKQQHIPNFDLSIDWGKRLWPLTRPIFFVLNFFYHLVGSFGVAILMLTVAVKILFFPLANQAFASMSKMKKLQPKVDELEEAERQRPAEAAAGNHGAVSAREGQSPGRLSADPDPDPGLLRLAQGALRRHRHAPGAVPVAEGPVGARPLHHLEPVRPDPVGSGDRASDRRVPGRHLGTWASWPSSTAGSCTCSSR